MSGDNKKCDKKVTIQKDAPSLIMSVDRTKKANMMEGY
jgi:hypothetical protein